MRFALDAAAPSAAAAPAAAAEAATPAAAAPSSSSRPPTGGTPAAGSPSPFLLFRGRLSFAAEAESTRRFDRPTTAARTGGAGACGGGKRKLLISPEGALLWRGWDCRPGRRRGGAPS